MGPGVFGIEIDGTLSKGKAMGYASFEIQIAEDNTAGENPRQKAPCPCIARIEFNRTVKQVDAGIIGLCHPGPDIGHCPHDAAPSIEAFRWFALKTKPLSSVKLRFDRRDDAGGDLVLHRENV